MKSIVFASAVLFAATGAVAAEIRFTPDDFLVLNPVENGHGVSDLVLHTTVVRTGPDERMTLTGVRFELLQGERVLLVRNLSAEEVVASSGSQNGPPVVLNLQLLDPHGLRGAILARSADLGPNQALVVAETYFSVAGAPDHLRVSASGAGPDGATRSVQASIPIRRHHSAYRFPLRGAWLDASLPMLESHHRMIASNEFAADFFKVDATGRNFPGDGADPASWYAYGEPVLAAADGEVVAVRDGAVQLHATPGEAQTHYRQRFGEAMEAGLQTDFRAALAGNLVTLRHVREGGAVEYTSYAHLKPGSIKVKPGARVSAGQVIAEVGDTGDAPVAHLHFQVNAGPDPFFSRSLPFTFTDTRWVGATQDPGRFIQSK